MMRMKNFIFIKKKFIARASSFFSLALFVLFILFALSNAAAHASSEPYPFDKVNDVFAVGVTGGKEPVAAFEKPVFDINKLTLKNGSQQAATSGLLLILRGSAATGKLTAVLEYADDKGKNDIDVYTAAGSSQSAPVQIKPGTSADYDIAWSISADRRVTPLELVVSSSKLAKIPFYAVHLSDADDFEWHVGMGKTEEGALYKKTAQSGKTVETSAMAAVGDKIFVKLSNWGSDVVTVKTTASADKTVYTVGFMDKAVSGLSLVYPAFFVKFEAGTVPALTPVSGGAAALPVVSRDMQIFGAGGYALKDTYSLKVTLTPYTENFTTPAVSGFALTAVSCDLPSSIKASSSTTSLKSENSTVEAASDKYLVSKGKLLAAVAFKMTCDAYSGDAKPYAQPVIIRWTVTPDMLQKQMTSADASAFVLSLRSSSTPLSDFFSRISVYKHMGSDATALNTLAAAELEKFFDISIDASGNIGLASRMIIVDGGAQGASALTENGVGWFVVNDGTKDAALIDPLSLNLMSGGGADPTPTANPQPTGGSAPSGGGGGCSSFGYMAIFSLLMTSFIFINNKFYNRGGVKFGRQSQ